MCLLTLRYYDRVMLQKTNRYREPAMAGLGPANIAYLDGARWQEIGAGVTVPLAKGSSKSVIAVGPERDYQNISGNPLKGRVNLTCADENDNPVANLWSASPAGKVALAITGTALRVTAGNTPGSAGEVTLTYRKDGIETSAKFNIP
jgi:hypothetical protein